MIDRYEAGGSTLKHAVDGLSRDDLMAVPIAGKWSIQQAVIHLLDSDLILADRMKRIIAEDKPSLIGFDENRFVSNLFYEEQPAVEAVAILDGNRRLFARVLRRLPEAAFERTGIHNERGPLRLDDLLRMTVSHLEHHLKFIDEKIEKLKHGTR